MKTKTENTYSVHFNTFIRPYHLEVPVKACDEGHAKRIARRICKFGYIHSVKEIREADANYVLGTEENTEHLIDCE